MKPNNAVIVKPSPFFNITFGCSNRAFYQIKSELYDIAESIDIEIEDGYISEECDYEGDLERIVIYRSERSEILVKAVMDFYEVKDEIPDEMSLVLSIF